jgi:hypothetical protein
LDGEIGALGFLTEDGIGRQREDRQDSELHVGQCKCRGSVCQSSLAMRKLRVLGHYSIVQ